MYDEFYNDKRVLITGHTGFKGSWLVLWLLKLGAKVIGYSLKPPTVPNHFEACRLSSKITHIHGDVMDLEHFGHILNKHKPELIFHFAAQALVRTSYENPRLTYETNIMGTVNVLEAIRTASFVRVCVIVTSDKCYASRSVLIESSLPPIASQPPSLTSPLPAIASPHPSYGYVESDPMGGDDPYSASKGCAELITASYVKSFFQQNKEEKGNTCIASVRAGNVIGGGDWGKDRLVPDCIKAFSRNQPVVIRYPDAVRPWQHVLEPLYGYLLLAKRLYQDGSFYEGGWNFGPNEDARSVKWLVENTVRLWGGNAKWQIDPDDHPHESQHLFLNSTKAGLHLNWRPSWPIETALAKTIKWYKAYTNREDMSSMTLNQIEEYETDCKNEKLLKEGD